MTVAVRVFSVVRNSIAAIDTIVESYWLWSMGLLVETLVVAVVAAVVVAAVVHWRPMIRKVL